MARIFKQACRQPQLRLIVEDTLGLAAIGVLFLGSLYLPALLG